jgi:hypothetical protein
LLFLSYCSQFIFLCVLHIMDFQNESRQRQPLLSDSNDEIDIPDDGHELLATKDEMITIREKMLSVACFFLLVGMCMFAYLYEKRGGGHHHGGAMDMSTLEQVSWKPVWRGFGVTM